MLRTSVSLITDLVDSSIDLLKGHVVDTLSWELS